MNTPDEMIACIQAHKDGKKLQYSSPFCCWKDVSGNPLFDFYNYEYRIKPEPKLRPWKPEEVPIGALIKTALSDRDYVPRVILGVVVNYHDTSDAIITNDLVRATNQGNYYFVGDLVTYHGGRGQDKILHSIDHGKTWHPCGVLE